MLSMVVTLLLCDECCEELKSGVPLLEQNKISACTFVVVKIHFKERRAVLCKRGVKSNTF